MGLLDSIKAPLKHRLKVRLAGTDVDALVQRRDRRRLRWLITDAEDPVLRFRALRHLSELMDPDAVDLFLAIVEDEPGNQDATMVRTAAEALGRMLMGDAAPALRRLLGANRPVSVQIAAARALATLGKDDTWSAVRAWAERVDDPEQPLFPSERDCVQPPKREPRGTTPVVWVVETLYADKDARWWSSKASRWLAGGDAKPRMKSDAGADKIVAAAHRNALERKDVDDAEFRRIVLHLGSLARARDYELLMGLVEAQTDLSRRRAAIQGLGLQADLRAAPAFEQWLAQVPPDQPELAADLARAAGRLGFRRLAPALIELYRRVDDADARSEVVAALGECGGEDAVRFLVDRVRDRDAELSDEDLRWLAIALLRCGVIGREAIRGSVAIARAGGGERDRVKRVAEIAGIH
jgi:HEAT repeat protein